MDKREQQRGPLHHELDTASTWPFTTSCGLDLAECFDLARKHGDTFAEWTLEPLTIQGLPENACPRCVRAITLGHVDSALDDAERVLRRVGQHRAAARLLAARRVVEAGASAFGGGRHVSR